MNLNEIIECYTLPSDINDGEVFDIQNKAVTKFTHIIHKYPSKFIPQIPAWAIEKYSEEGDIVLDPFMGSATTLVESVLRNRTSVGIDINPVARLIAKVKTTPINIDSLVDTYNQVILNYNNDRNRKDSVIPLMPNIEKWFTETSITNLSIMKYYILQVDNKDIRDFLMVVFSAIIRKTSNAEYRSQKTYISSRFMKKPKDVYEIFDRRFNQYIQGMKSFNEVVNKNTSDCKIVLGSANDFSKENLSLTKGIDLIITSPPYVTAVEYPSVFKLEYQWLDYFEDSEINEHRKEYIGTDRVYATEYKNIPQSGYEKLDIQLASIFENSPKKAYILYKYFMDMKKHLECVYDTLKSNGRYVLVVGNNSVMNIEIQVSEHLILIAESLGLKKEFMFSYVLKDRHLIFPRNGRGGIIDKDWVIVFEK